MKSPVVVVLALALAAPALAQAPPGPTPDAARVRIVTYNVWGIPVVTPRRAERMARIGGAVLALRPDIACFQEAWLDGDQDTLARDLAAGGLIHAQRFASWPGTSGLLIASRWPITSSAFTRCRVGGEPHRVWRGDWWGGKGVGRVRLDGPLGPLDLADTHLHARYGTDQFLGFQVAQAADVRGALAGADCPLILAGDLNSRPDAAPFEVIAQGSGLRSVDRRLGIDHVLVRPGATHDLRVVSVEVVLKEDVALGDGTSMPLSDHHGVLVELALEPRGRSGPVDAAAWPASAQAGRAALDAELEASAVRAWTARGLLLLAIITCALLAARKRRLEPGRGRSALAAALVVVSLLGLGCAYAGLALEPWLQRGLGAAAEMLE